MVIRFVKRVRFVVATLTKTAKDYLNKLRSLLASVAYDLLANLQHGVHQSRHDRKGLGGFAVCEGRIPDAS